jgi:hypothetical protein
MKKILTLALIVSIIALLSCEKEDINSNLIGKWELRASSGGYRDLSLPAFDYSPGNGTILKFTDKKYFEYSKGGLTKSGKYTITKQAVSWQEEPAQRIIYDNNTSMGAERFFEINGDKLIIYVGAPISLDGIEQTYQKL